MGLNRILGRGDNDLSITKGVRNFPYYEFYETSRDFGISPEDLVDDVERWTEELCNTVRYSSDYNQRNLALWELKNLHIVSKSEIVENVLRELYGEGIYDELECSTDRIINHRDIRLIYKNNLKKLWPPVLLTAGTLGYFIYLFANS